MKKTVSFYDFERAFHAADRFENFGYDGLKVIFDALEELEDDMGHEIELDVIAICCEYTMQSPEEIAEQYDIDVSDCEDDNDIRDTVEEYLTDNTWLLGETEDGQFVFQEF